MGEETEPMLNDKSEESDYSGKYNTMDASGCQTPGGRSQTHLLMSGIVDKITLSWHDINVFVRQKGKTCNCCGSKDDFSSLPKHILRGVSGLVRPYELLAIMGASGAGKTTLLNALTMRSQSSLIVDGDVRLNGSTVSTDTFISQSAYVQQDDLFIGTLTVREQLIFQAMVRIHRSVPYAQRMQRVEEVIKELGLTKCANTVIGTPGSVKGISGGEMKRLAFAAEVLTNPPILLCDEPTSGLDSFMAQNVVSVLKQMAAKGKTILCTIHQPSSEVFAMFDRLLLMAEGRVVYLGDTQGATHFFHTQGYECPSNYNPADYFIHTMAIIPGYEEERRKRVEAFADHFQETDVCKRIKTNLAALEIEDDRLLDTALGRKKRSPYRATWCRQLSALLWRSCLTILREPLLLKVRIFQTLIVAVLLAVIFFGQVVNQEGVMNLNGAMFLFLTNMTFQNLFGVINVFCMEVPIFMREHSNGMYRSDTYFLAKTLAELPMFIIIPVLFTAVTYWAIGFSPDWIKFAMACAIVTLVTNCACSFGYMVSTFSKNITIALSVASPLVTPLLLFGGFFLNTKTFPEWLSWLQYLSWFRFGNEALAINQWSDITMIECNRPSNESCILDGQTVLESYGFHAEDMYFTFLMMAAQLIGFRLLAYIALYARARRAN